LRELREPRVNLALLGAEGFVFLNRRVERRALLGNGH